MPSRCFGLQGVAGRVYLGLEPRPAPATPLHALPVDGVTPLQGNDHFGICLGRFGFIFLEDVTITFAIAWPFTQICPKFVPLA